MSLTNGEVRHMAVVEAQLRRMADALERQADDRAESGAGDCVWAVVSADPKSDEPGYLAYCEVFATRRSALESLRKSAEQDAECFDSQGKTKWYNEDTDEPWCEVYCGDEVRVTHMLEKKTVKL